MKCEDKGLAVQHVGKAKVELDVHAELKVGQSATHKGRKIWLDFKYERLPFFRHSCRKVGHYASYYKEIPYDEQKFTSKMGCCYRNWLRAEVQDHSPFWDVFYEKKFKEDNEEVEEIIPEPQEQQRQIVVVEEARPSTPVCPRTS